MKLVDDPYLAGWAAGWTPDPRLTVSQWADKHRKLGSKSSAEPGDWRTDRAPYAREPMDCLSAHDPAQIVVLMFGAQTSKTEAGLNWAGYVMHHSPGPMMLVQPTVDMAKRLSKQRLADMVAETPALKDRVGEARSRDSGNTLLMKDFPGGVLVLAGANSASGLRSMPARYLFLDEVDAYPLDVEGEGDPISLAIKRTTTFGRRRKVLITSTPTLRDQSRVEKEFLRSDQRRYFIPCPHCGHMQWLRWRGYTDSDDEQRAKAYRLVWIDEAKTRAGYLCGAADCGAIIEEHHKTKMLLAGEWGATATGDPGVRGYWLSSLYSPLGWKAWAEVLQEFEQAAHDPAQLKTFVNTVLAETWEDATTQRLDAEGLAARAGGYSLRTIPAGGLLVTCGVDIQRRGGGYAQLVWRAWGHGDESWLVDREIIYGDPMGDQLWTQVLAAIEREYPHESGVSMKAYAAAVDSGDGETVHQVYAFARRHMRRKIIATKGQSQYGKPVIGKPTRQDVNIRRQTIKNGVNLWPIGADTAKSVIHARIKIAAEAGPGVIHWPEGLPPDYWKQLTAERQVTKSINGFTRRVWVKNEGDYNEDLDCEVLALASLEYAKTRFAQGLMYRTLGNRLAQGVSGLNDAGGAPVQSATEEPSPAPPPVTMPVTRGVSLKGWRRG